MTDLVLALNAGSSSVKFALARAEAPEAVLMSGCADRLESGIGCLRLSTPAATEKITLQGTGHAAALGRLFDEIAARFPGQPLRAVAHRIVHGGSDFTLPVRVTPRVFDALSALVPLAPLHQPHGLAGIAAAQDRYPQAEQIACFDTAFHAGKPWVHDAFALPAHFYADGLRRYGFHGLACQSVVEALAAQGVPLDQRKLVIAHLGNGCSVTAIAQGRALASSMGFSALDGLAMGTRSGRIDPGVLLHLLRRGYDADQLEHLLYRQSGLLGLSGLSSDMRDLQAAGSDTARAAIDYFIARAVEEISRMAGVMGGLDVVAFSGGIGENAADIRKAIMDGLAFLPGHAGQGVDCRVVAADEERLLLRAACGADGSES